MIKWALVVIAAALFASAPMTLAADEPAEKKPAREESDKRKEEWKKLSPEEREAKRAEIKGRLEKRICELRTKMTNNTLSAQESHELSRSEQILKRFEPNGPRPKGERTMTNAPAAPAPPEK